MDDKRRDYWFPRDVRWYGPFRANIGMTKKGILFIVAWQITLWGFIAIAGATGIDANIAQAVKVSLFALGIVVLLAKTEIKWF